MSITNYALSQPRRVKPKTARRVGVGPKGRPLHVHQGEVRGAGAAVTIITGPGVAGPGTTVSFGGNPIIMTARVALLFYGNVWNDLSLSPNCVDVQSAVQTILAMPYLSALLDYQCNGAHMNTIWNRIITDPPGNPFDGDDAGDVADDLIDNYYSTLPTYNRPNFYAVFLPPGVSLELSNVNGAHSYDGSTRYSWQLYGSLDFTTSTFTYELVEAMTDPDGDGWQVDPRNDTSWNEIADVCANRTMRVNGVSVAAYFSTSNNACVVPQPDPPPPPPPPPPKLPDGEHQISCALFDYHNGIRYVGIIGGVWDGKSWAMSTDQAITRMQQGGLSLYTWADGKKAAVKIGHSLVHAFLTTSADATEENNLDVIAQEHPCPTRDLWV
jgi:hypothetical protein